MSDDGLVSIGVFALLSGLSVPALRHYDDVEVLKPAAVDPVTGYRRYRPDQVPRARMVCALRAVDLPIEALREVLTHDDETFVNTALAAHRERLERRAEELNQMVRTVDRYLEGGFAMPAVQGCRAVQIKITVTDLGESVRFYQELFGAQFNEDICSLQFGAYQSDQFFLLTIYEAGQEDAGPPGTGHFGFLVDDLDAFHQRALAAGASENYPPFEASWKPRSSCVSDPGGNRIDLYQG